MRDESQLITSPVLAAMLLLAINPTLGGLVLAGGSGTGKSSMLRAFPLLLEPLEAIATCPLCCDPCHPAAWCNECTARYPQGHPPVAVRPVPVIELPLGTSEDRLLGGLDFEATLTSGRREVRPGLLVKANRGFLMASELNLLDQNLANHILTAMSAGSLQVEREGLSACYPARFCLLASYNPAEGDLRMHLLDRVGLIVATATSHEPEQHLKIMRVALAAQGERDEWQALRTLVRRGRDLLPSVTIEAATINELAATALALGVEGNRADIFAVECARSSAALHGRKTIEERDLTIATQLVLLPRSQQPEEIAPAPPQTPDSPAEDGGQASEQAANEQASSAANMHPLPLEDLVLQALDTALPLDMAGLKLQRGFARDRGKSGRHGRLLNLRRGRHIRSLPGKPSQGRIALMATIHAAIPFQQLRSGRPHLQIEPDKTEPDTGRRIILRAVDIRLKQFRDKAGTLFLFAVDASGSMAINRMRQAKGAVNRLLQQAYIHRDQVALLAFRNHDAQVLLPPSQSVERAKRALDSLPVGGGTPLAAGLRLSLELIEHAQRRGTRQVMLVLLTDGRANVPLQAAAGSENREQIASEIEQLATHIRATGIRSLVIDTQRAYTGGSESRLLANLLAARYLLLPNAAAEEIAKAVQQLVT